METHKSERIFMFLAASRKTPAMVSPLGRKLFPINDFRLAYGPAGGTDASAPSWRDLHELGPFSALT